MPRNKYRKKAKVDWDGQPLLELKFNPKMCCLQFLNAVMLILNLVLIVYCLQNI